jgi:hypothetical protein
MPVGMVDSGHADRAFGALGGRGSQEGEVRRDLSRTAPRHRAECRAGLAGRSDQRTLRGLGCSHSGFPICYPNAQRLRSCDRRPATSAERHAQVADDCVGGCLALVGDQHLAERRSGLSALSPRIRIRDTENSSLADSSPPCWRTGEFHVYGRRISLGGSCSSLLFLIGSLRALGWRDERRWGEPVGRT